MNLTKFYELQQSLDNDIIAKKNLQGQHLTDKKHIAFKVEISELINEIRSFKFWSNREPSTREVIIEEWVDGWHFLMSLANDYKYNFVTDVRMEGLDVLSINDLSMDLLDNPLNCASSYKRAVMCMLAIADKLGFSEDDIHKAYAEKNKVNYERQANEY